MTMDLRRGCAPAWLLRVALLFGLVGGGLAVGVVDAAPAFAGCYASGCNGQNPNTAGCDAGAYALQSFSQSGVYVELRYSPSCNAVWARGVSYNQQRNCTGWTDQDLLTIEGSTNRSSIAVRYQRCLSSAPGYMQYTEMVGFNYWTRACNMVYRVWDPNYVYNGCTAWR